MWEAAAVVAVFILSVVVAVISSLLQKRDEAQEEKIKAQSLEIAELFRKHDEDSLRLSNFENKLYQEYHTKYDLKEVFADFKSYFNERFSRVEEAMGIDRRKGGGPRD